jgi:NRAMP (natural resistance-associated macrophage protein)-like metal ion transporter
MSWSFFRSLGPGLVTGASDDDPSGIATYTQAGVGFGFATLWIALFTTPLMIAVQEMCARIGLVAKTGLTSVFLRKFPRWLVMIALLLLAGANVFNIGADLSMMASSAKLLIPLPIGVWLVFFTVLTLCCQIFIPYRIYARYLKWLTMSLLAYIFVALVIHLPWAEVWLATWMPQFIPGKTFTLMVIAILGTTLSPYLYFWQANQEVEERREHKRRAGEPETAMRDMRSDVTSGMAFSNVVFWFIVATTAVVLRPAGIFEISTADQAARVLAPLVGHGAFLLFTLGILGTGLLTVPILAGSLAYALSELFGWQGSLAKTWRESPKFYAAIVGFTLLGGILNLLHIPPVRALIYSAIANAVVAPPLLGALLIVANDRKILGKWTNGRWANLGGMISFLVMSAATFLWMWFFLF